MEITHALIKLEKGDHKIIPLWEFLELSEEEKKSFVSSDRLKFMTKDGHIHKAKNGLLLIQKYLNKKEIETSALSQYF